MYVFLWFAKRRKVMVHVGVTSVGSPQIRRTMKSMTVSFPKKSYHKPRMKQLLG